MRKLLLIVILFAMPNTVLAGEYGMANSLNELLEIRDAIRSRLKDQMHMNPSAHAFVKEGVLLAYCACSENPGKFYYITGGATYVDSSTDAIQLASKLGRLARAKCGGCTDRPAAYFLHWTDSVTRRIF